MLIVDKKERCPLCSSNASYFTLYRKAEYYRCSRCMSVFMAPAFHPAAEQEKARYETHNNDVNDPGYRAFVAPLVQKVMDNHGPRETGLDFGAGTGPVAATILREHSYNVSLYDPFFIDDRQKLEQKYDYIICCEVIEHFHSPAREFGLLRSMIKPGGSLICMTRLYTDDIDFGKWVYKDDHTHVFFYHPESLGWIKTQYSFYSLETADRIIHFRTA